MRRRWLGTVTEMKKLSALAAVGVAALLLSGCSEQASTLAACGQVATQAVQVSGVIDTVTSQTPETAQAALDEVGRIVENIRAIDGPTEFTELRDSWTTSIDSFVAEGQRTIAGDPGNMDAATTQLRTATEAVVAYCAP